MTDDADRQVREVLKEVYAAWEANVDFHAANLVFWSGELEAEAASLPPGDDGVCAEVGLAQDG